VDRGLVFGILAVVAIVALVLWVVAVLPAPEGLLPMGAYGFWIAAVGAIVMGRAAFEISQERPRR
jgi:ABC-type Co2+ transport system permease subunit